MSIGVALLPVMLLLFFVAGCVVFCAAFLCLSGSCSEAQRVLRMITIMLSSHSFRVYGLGEYAVWFLGM